MYRPPPPHLLTSVLSSGATSPTLFTSSLRLPLAAGFCCAWFTAMGVEAELPEAIILETSLVLTSIPTPSPSPFFFFGAFFFPKSPFASCDGEQSDSDVVRTVCGVECALPAGIFASHRRSSPC